MADRQPNVELQMSSDAWTNKQYSSDCMTGGQFSKSGLNQLKLHDVWFLHEIKSIW